MDHNRARRHHHQRLPHSLQTLVCQDLPIQAHLFSSPEIVHREKVVLLLKQ